MGVKPLKTCRHPGCLTLTPNAYCVKHQRKQRGSRSAEAETWRWMYKTDEWKKKLRPAQLAKEPFCRECAKIGLRVYAEDVDHIVDHKGDPVLFSDPNNLQSLCHSCHSRKTISSMQKAKQKEKALRWL